MPKYSSVFDVGFCDDINTPFRKTMEDRHVVVDKFIEPYCGYFGVYDGHGGIQAVEIVERELHVFVQREVSQLGSGAWNPEDVMRAYMKAYKDADEKCRLGGCEYVGTTSVTCIVRKDSTGTRKLYTANCGDARAVLCRAGSAKRLSIDHRTNVKSEQQRIEQDGGVILNMRVNAVLSVTRALGDFALKKSVISRPDYSAETLTPQDEYIIIACDGLWDVIPDETASKIAHEHFMSGKPAQNLSEELLKRAKQEGSMDNISVMVVQLIPFPQ